MSKRKVSVCLIVAIALSFGFILTNIYTFTWATDIPKTTIHEIVRIFYMAHALTSVTALEFLPDGINSEGIIYTFVFVVTLPVSIIYVLVPVVCGGLIRRIRGIEE